MMKKVCDENWNMVFPDADDPTRSGASDRQVLSRTYQGKETGVGYGQKKSRSELNGTFSYDEKNKYGLFLRVVECCYTVELNFFEKFVGSTHTDSRKTVSSDAVLVDKCVLYCVSTVLRKFLVEFRISFW